MPSVDGWIDGLLFVAKALAPLILPFLFFGVLERLAPAGPLKSAQGWWLNLRLMLVYLSIPTMLGVWIKALVAEARHYGGGVLWDAAPFIYPAGLFAMIGGCLLTIVIWDFFYYWWHRAQHSWGLLWRVHSLHHMDETLGVSTNMRVHWLEEIGRTATIFLPMAFLFNLPVHAGFIAVVATFWTAFIHANLRLHFGWASLLVAGPQVHRIHHSRLKIHHDRNFAAFFPVWDRLFGTYHHPAPGEFPPTGVDGQEEVRSVWEAVTLPFRRQRSAVEPPARAPSPA